MQPNLRMLPENAHVEDRSVTAILIRGTAVFQAKKKGEKREMAAFAKPEDLLLCAWTGQWSTDVFVLPLERLVAI